MHNNYFFIRQLSAQLKEILAGSHLRQCFSQNKEELVLAFTRADQGDFFIQANLGNDFSSLCFPETYHKAKRNVAVLFPELEGHAVRGIRQVANERAFVIQFENNYFLLFKLYGNRSNILLFHHHAVKGIFKKNLGQDALMDLRHIDRPMDVSFQNFENNQWKAAAVIFTMGKIGEKYLLEAGYEGMSPEEKFKLLQHTLSYLEQPLFYVTRIQGVVCLSLFASGEVISEHISPLEAINAFYSDHFKYNHFARSKEKVRNRILEICQTAKAYLGKMKSRASELESSIAPGQIADILMANLYNIPLHSEKATLFDFYRNNDIEIKLKKNLSPQKNAELLYRKEKNRHIEIKNTTEQLSTREAQLLLLEEDLRGLEAVEDYRGLEAFTKKYILSPEKEKQEAVPRFKNFEFHGFKIFVGRNAGNNDELTQKFAHKDDLWLHAKDVQGSHVIIQHQAGKPFPKDVIQKAAAVAAFYSKRKTDTLCPVICTPKKFVRKVKGSAKGSVRVEREQVVMVVPADI